MQRAGMPPQDFSPFQAELFASVASHLLPGCWGGRVPPITLAGRHARIDQLVRKLHGESGRLLDIACGFPPLTTIDGSSALTDVNDRLRAKHGLCPRLPDGYFRGRSIARRPSPVRLRDFSDELEIPSTVGQEHRRLALLE